MGWAARVNDFIGNNQDRSGTVILSGVSTNAGLTTISNGTLVVTTIADSGPSAIGTNTLQLRGGTLRYTGAGAVTTIRTVTVPVASTIDLPGQPDLDGVTSGVGGLTKSGNGTLSLGGTNDNNNFLLNVTAGEVQLNKASTNDVNAMAGIIEIANGATVKITGTGGDQIYNGNAVNYGVNGVVAGSTFDLNGNSETISFLNGTGGTVEGGSGTPTLTVVKQCHQLVQWSYSKHQRHAEPDQERHGHTNLGRRQHLQRCYHHQRRHTRVERCGSIGNSPLIDLKANGTLDVSAVTGAYVLGAAQTLKGSGTMTGSATANGQITPGAGIGTLSFSAPPTLNGTIVMELDTAQSPSNDVINVTSGTLAAGGSLNGHEPARQHISRGPKIQAVQPAVSVSFGIYRLSRGAKRHGMDQLAGCGRDHRPGVHSRGSCADQHHRQCFQRECDPGLAGGSGLAASGPDELAHVRHHHQLGDRARCGAAAHQRRRSGQSYGVLSARVSVMC